MDIYIGRQPILNKRQKTVAYELLYREGPKNEFPNIESHEATSKLLHNLFASFGLNEVSLKRPVFINFGKQMLLSGLPHFNPKSVVVEILEGIKFDSDLIKAFKMLVKKGFKLALDDYILEDSSLPILPLASIVKIDWKRDSLDEIKRILDQTKKFNLTLLAEKIETKEQFKLAKQMGFSLFQGYFFARPSIIKGRGLSSNELTRVQLLATINKKEVEIKELIKIIKHDIALIYKLLKIINSASYGLSRKISSVEEAVILLGLDELKKWLSIILVSDMAQEKTDALLNLALVRANFCENLAKLGQIEEISSKAFLTGLLSMLPAILNYSLENILKDLPVEPDIISALLKRDGILGQILTLAESYENIKEKQIVQSSIDLKMSQAEVTNCYLKALKKADSYCELI